jgi:hypothetical protein
LNLYAKIGEDELEEYLKVKDEQIDEINLNQNKEDKNQSSDEIEL